MERLFRHDRQKLLPAFSAAHLRLDRLHILVEAGGTGQALTGAVELTACGALIS